MNIIPPKSNALNLLSPLARERFIATLTFNEKGVTGFGFEELQRGLSKKQIAKVLALFGSESSAQHIKPAAEKHARPIVSSNNCFEAQDRFEATICPDPYGGGIGGGGIGGGMGGGSGGGGGGGFHPHSASSP